MTYKEVSAMISSVNLPCAYYQFPNDTPQTPPFILFYFTGADDLYADDKNYQRIVDLIVEFYSDNKDFETESTIENTLTSNGLTYTKAEQYIDSEHMHETIYGMQVLVKPTNQ